MPDESIQPEEIDMDLLMEVRRKVKAEMEQEQGKKTGNVRKEKPGGKPGDVAPPGDSSS